MSASAAVPDIAGDRVTDIATPAAAAGAVLLGALALTPVFASGIWFPPAAFAVLVVFAGGLLARAAGPALWARLSGGRPVPTALHAVAVPLVPLGQLVLLGCVLTTLFAPDRAFVGLVPTWSSLRDLGSVLADGSAEMQEQAVPALPLHGLVALTVVLLGLVAVAVDLVAVAGAQPALGGLGLLVVFCVPIATIKGGIGLVAIIAPAAGMALLLWAGQRRRLTERTSGRRGMFGAGSLPALRTGALALVVGLGGGTLVPTLAEGTFTSGPATAGGTGGGGTGASLDPVAVMHGQLVRPDPVNLLRLQTSVSDPGYLRSVSLDHYDPVHGWTLSGLDGETSVGDSDRLAALPARQQSRQVTAKVTVLGLRDRFLPVPTSPLRVTVRDPQDWRFDPTTGTVFARGTTSSGTYQVTASEPRPSAALLQSSPALTPGNPLLQRYTSLPPLPPTVTDLVSSLTANATTPYGRVRAILDYFTDPANGFTYSLSAPVGTSRDHLLDFLQNKQGYCEQYAGAMAALVRAAGVPARVALGYTPGTPQPGGSRVISSNDAHAWVEVYFADLGWVPFDPTPVADTRAVTLPWAPRLGGGNTTTLPGDAPAAAAPTQSVPTRGLDRADQATPALRPVEQAGWLRPVLLTLGGLLLVVVLAALPATARIVQRRRRLAAGSPGALWDEVTATAQDLRLRLAPAWTPRQAARELAEAMTAAAPEPGGRRRTRRPDAPEGGVDAIRRLALAEEAATYAPPDRSAVPGGLVPAVREARRALTRATPFRRRVRAVLWPASLISGLAEWRRGWTGRRLPRTGRRRTRTV